MLRITTVTQVLDNSITPIEDLAMTHQEVGMTVQV